MDGFFEPANYRGAFAPGANNDNWLSDWTYSQVLNSTNGVVACPTDINNDGTTDVNDFLIFAPAFGTTNASASPTDLNSDGVTDVNDFLIFAPEFGTPCN